MPPTPTRLGPRFAEAVAWVSERHAGQLRKGGDTPYVSHLLAVAALTLEDGGTERDAIVALCHDVVEDQGGLATLAELRRRFGDDVADAVSTLSDCEGEPKPPWLERKRGMVVTLARPEVGEGVLRVAAADKLHNVRSLLLDLELEGEAAWRRFNAPPADVLWFYRAMADVLRARLPGSRNVEALGREVTDLEGWAARHPASVSA